MLIFKKGIYDDLTAQIRNNTKTKG